MTSFSRDSKVTGEGGSDTGDHGRFERPRSRSTFLTMQIYQVVYLRLTPPPPRYTFTTWMVFSSQVRLNMHLSTCFKTTKSTIIDMSAVRSIIMEYRCALQAIAEQRAASVRLYLVQSLTTRHYNELYRWLFLRLNSRNPTKTFFMPIVSSYVQSISRNFNLSSHYIKDYILFAVIVKHPLVRSFQG